MDFRRSGQVEALAGEAKVEAVAAEMANSIDQNPNCKRPTYPRAGGGYAAMRNEARSRIAGRFGAESQPPPAALREG